MGSSLMTPKKKVIAHKFFYDYILSPYQKRLYASVRWKNRPCATAKYNDKDDGLVFGIYLCSKIHCVLEGHGQKKLKLEKLIQYAFKVNQ